MVTDDIVQFSSLFRQSRSLTEPEHLRLSLFLLRPGPRPRDPEMTREKSGHRH